MAVDDAYSAIKKKTGAVLDTLAGKSAPKLNFIVAGFSALLRGGIFRWVRSRLVIQTSMLFLSVPTVGGALRGTSKPDIGGR